MSAGKAYGRIKPGTFCYQDMSFFKWPGRYDPNLRFEFTALRSKDRSLVAQADGFGFGVPGSPRGMYGNGSITVYKPPTEVHL